MLVGPWAGEEESAQSVLKEDDLGEKRDRQRLPETEPSRWRCACREQLNTHGLCRGSRFLVGKPSLEAPSAREPPALPRMEPPGPR